MGFLTALQFLTIIRLPGRREVSIEELGQSLSYFPVVGFIIGLILTGLSYVLGLVLPLAVVNALLVVSLVVVSGGLHLDGFIDTCDGIGGNKTVEQRWQIMHDSRVGGFGVIGAFCMLLVKYISLNSVPAPLLMPTLVLMPVVSRWAMVYALFAYPYARPSGLGKVFKQGANWQRFTTATIITLALTTGLAWWANITYYYLAGLAIMFSIWLIVVIMAAYLKSKFAGLTGDTYGAINEVAEVFMLFLVLVLAHNQWFQLT